MKRWTGWQRMSALEEYEETRKRMNRMMLRRAYLAQRGAPQAWLDDYDEQLAYDANKCKRLEPEIQDAFDAERRKAYEEADYYGCA